MKTEREYYDTKGGCLALTTKLIIILIILSINVFSQEGTYYGNSAVFDSVINNEYTRNKYKPLKSVIAAYDNTIKVKTSDFSYTYTILGSPRIENGTTDAGVNYTVLSLDCTNKYAEDVLISFVDYEMGRSIINIFIGKYLWSIDITKK